MDPKTFDFLRVSLIKVPQSDAARWSFEDIKHGAPINVGEPRNGVQLQWLPWKTMSSPEQFKLSYGLVQDLLVRQSKEFDAVACMSPEALAMGSVAAALLTKELVHIDNITYTVLPYDAIYEPRLAGRRIVMFDSVIQTGKTLSVMADRLESMDGRIVGVICLGLNDLVKDRDEKTICSFEESGKLKYLFRFSEVYDLWVKKEIDL